MNPTQPWGEPPSLLKQALCREDAPWAFPTSCEMLREVQAAPSWGWSRYGLCRWLQLQKGWNWAEAGLRLPAQTVFSLAYGFQGRSPSQAPALPCRADSRMLTGKRVRISTHEARTHTQARAHTHTGARAWACTRVRSPTFRILKFLLLIPRAHTTLDPHTLTHPRSLPPPLPSTWGWIRASLI